MSDKYESKTPGYKQSSSSSSKIHMEFIPSPNKSKTSITVKNIEDEEFPHGYTWLETLTPTKLEEGKILEKNKPESHSSDIPSNSGDGIELSLVAQYDEIIRYYEECFEDDLTGAFLEFAEHQELCRLEWLKSVQECRRLQLELDKANHEIGDFANKLRNARRLLDQERKLRRLAEDEKCNLQQQMLMARDLLFSEKSSRIPDDTKEKLAFLNSSSIRSFASLDRNVPASNAKLHTINELNVDINSTGSLLSDFSYSRSEDDLDTSTIHKMKSEEWKRPQQIISANVPTPKKQRSTSHKIVEINPNDKIVATTTLSVSKEGPITATSVIEAVPQDSDPETPASEQLNLPLSSPSSKVLEKLSLKDKPSPTVSSSSSGKNKQHTFVSKTMLCPDTCSSCKTRIRFGKIVAKCKECKGICHVECKNDLPAPCIPVLRTPTQKGNIGSLADFCPTLPPLVPALIVHCVNEIELRGLREIGIYRIPGSEKDIRVLKEKFLRSKSTPNINYVDVHVLCAIIKDFLRSLKEPLVTFSIRKDFIQAAEVTDALDVVSCFYQAISELPQPNRDTLAYLMLHLNRVAESKICKMPAENLAKIFGPTIIGYSARDIEPNMLLTETKQQLLVMNQLMKIPTDFWATYINVESRFTTARSKTSSKTPSSGSLSRVNLRRRFFTADEPGSATSSTKRKKYFGTPPSSKK